MTIERKSIEAAFAALHEHENDGDSNAYVDQFSIDCSGDCFARPTSGCSCR